MVEIFEINSYEEIIRDADEVLAWLKSLRVNVENSRLVNYRETIRILNDALKKGTVAEAEKRPEFPMVCDSLFELSVISRIHKQLKDEKAYPPLRRLRLVTKGAFSSLDEKKSKPNRQARDIQFELLTLAMMKRQGMVYKPLPAETDVSGIFEERPIITECKRLWSDKKVEDNIKFGLSQLTIKLNRLPDSERPVGLLGLDFTRLISPPGHLLECASSQDAKGKLDGLVEKSLRLYRPFWSKSPDIRYIGVIGYLGAVIVLKDRALLSAAHRFGIMDFCLRNSVDFQFLGRLFRN